MRQDIREKVVEDLGKLPKKEADAILEILPAALRKRRFEWLFDNQINALESRGLGEVACGLLRDRKKSVVENAIRLNVPDNHYPFIPNLDLDQDLSWLTRRAVYCGSSVRIDFELSEVVDTIQVSPYSFTFDINDGWGVRDFAVADAAQSIEEMGKSPLTLGELIMFYILNSEAETAFVQGAQSLGAIGSKIESQGESFIPDLYPEESELVLGALLLGNGAGRSFPFCSERS
jgi:hypothetical protein